MVRKVNAQNGPNFENGQSRSKVGGVSTEIGQIKKPLVDAAKKLKVDAPQRSKVDGPKGLKD